MSYFIKIWRRLNEKRKSNRKAVESQECLTRSNSAVDRSGSGTQISTADITVSPDSSFSDDELVYGRDDLPAWDRTVDVVYHKYKYNDRRRRFSKRAAFEASLEDFLAQHSCQGLKADGFLKLPDGVRFRIFRHLVTAHGPVTKPICLNRFCFNQDCWDPPDFVTLGEALEPFASYLQVSFGFYADMILTFLSTHTFHALLSPFVAPGLNPLATMWLNKYGPYMPSLIIEIDLSRLAFGPDTDAIELYPGLGYLEKLLEQFSVSQLNRPRANPLDSLILLCRRFYGCREDDDMDTVLSPSPSPSQTADTSCGSPSSPQSQYSPTETARGSPVSDLSEARIAFPDLELLDPDDAVCDTTGFSSSPDITAISNLSLAAEGDETCCSTVLAEESFTSTSSTDSSTSESEILYCPEEYFLICNHLLRLRNRVNSIRMAGFTPSYTHRFIATLFPGSMDEGRHPATHHSYRVAPSTLWPRIGGQASCIDLGEGFLVVDDHETVAETSIFPEGPVQLPPPVVLESGVTTLPWCFRATTRSRNNTISSSASWPSRGSSPNGDDFNLKASTISVPSGEGKIKMLQWLEKYKAVLIGRDMEIRKG